MPVFLSAWCRPLAARRLLVAYWLAIAVVTHWPGLGVPGAEHAVDKVIHALAFAGLAVLVWLADPGRRSRSAPAGLVRLGLVAGVYAYVDELTQPWVGRIFSMYDIAANLAGVGSVLLAVAWLGECQGRRERLLAVAWRMLLLLIAPLAVALALMPSSSVDAPQWVSAATGMGAARLDQILHVAAGLALLPAVIGARVLGADRRGAWSAVALAIAIGPAVEWAQWISGRGCEWADVAAHELGVLIAGLLVWSWHRATRGIDRTDSDSPSQPPGDAPAARPQAKAGPDRQSATSPDQDPRTAADRARAGAAGFVRHVRTVAGLTLLSRFTGLVRDSSLAALFGVSGVASAFMFGFQVPNLFRRLFGEGALTAAFIPIYTELRQDDPALARRFASACMAGLTVLLGAITLLGEAILAALLAWGEWTPTSVMAIELMMVMLPYMPLVCLVAVMGGILQVHGRFGPTASAPVLLNVVMIAAAIFAGVLFRTPDAQPQGAYLIGASVVAAGAIQLAWQAVALLSHERFTRRFQGVGRPVGELWRTMVPMMLGLAVFQINTAFDTFIAFALSFKEGGSAGFQVGQWYVAYPMNEGAVAALTWAQRLYQFPLGVFGIAVATAIFPALAAAAAQRKTDGGVHYQAVLHQGLRLTFFIGLPASAGLILIRLPLARMAFQYGRFDLDDAHRVATILAGYATAVWAYSMTHVVTRAFYAVKDSRTPLRITMFNLVLNVTLNLTLIWPLGAAGLAWSTALCAMWQAALLLRAVRRYVAQPVDRTVWIGWARTIAITLAMVAALGAALTFIDTGQLSRKASALVLMAVVGAGAAIFIVGAWITGADELRWLLHRRAREPAPPAPS